MFTNLDETAAIFWNNTIGKIASFLSNVINVSDTFFKCGSLIGYVSAMMAAMISLVAAYPMMIVMLLPLLSIIKYILIGLIIYGAARVFGNINTNIQSNCKQ